MGKNRKLLVYTSTDPSKKRIVRESMHLAISNEDGTSYRKLNCDEGVLYAEADYQKDPQWGAPRSLTDPYIFRMKDGRFGIIAVKQELVRTEDDFDRVKTDSGDCTVLSYSSSDLLTYNKEREIVLEKGEIKNFACEYNIEQADAADWNMGGEVPLPQLDKAEVTSSILITEEEAQTLIEHLGVPLDKNGKAQEDEGSFMIPHRADPCILKYENRYLFVATYDEGGTEEEGKSFQRNIYMRQSDTIEGLAQAKEVKVYDSHGLMVWAPEIHKVNGRLMLFFATTRQEHDSWAYVQSYVMTLEGEDPLDEMQWGIPQRVKKQDGSDLMKDGEGITLDMTWFEWKKKQYVMWSQRTVESYRPTSSADIYIARLDQNVPYLLASDPVRVSTPSYGWERKNTEVDEGPFAFIHNDTLFVTFSADGTDPSYRIGLLTLKENADPLDENSWKKTGYPLLGTAHNPAQPGPGHSCFTYNEDNQPMLVYHWGKVGSSRNTTVKAVAFYRDGSLNLRRK